MAYKPGYAQFCAQRFKIVNKQSEEVPFVPNAVQQRYLNEGTGWDVILKARQEGFSSIIGGVFTIDFLLKPYTRNVVVADLDENAEELLGRVKEYVASYEENTGVKVPLKYNSKIELYNEAMKSRYTIGTAKNVDFGRSKTITNLHLSEFSRYPHPKEIFSGALQAVVEGGRAIIETTANGYNFFQQLWDECLRGERPFKPLFYGASEVYSAEFLDRKRAELQELFPQEYPNTAEEAFLHSGNPFFAMESLKSLQDRSRDAVMAGGLSMGGEWL